VQRLVVLVVVVVAAAPAAAATCAEMRARIPSNMKLVCTDEVPRRHAQIQADLGLSVIQGAYEHPITKHVSASLSAGVFGSYFLPWFDRGDNVIGVGGGARMTWFQRASGRGFYVAPYVRVHRVSGDHDDMHGSGLGFSAGAFAGWVFGLGKKLDLRVGAGAQYIRHELDTDGGTFTSSTPFIALDLVVGYRL